MKKKIFSVLFAMALVPFVFGFNVVYAEPYSIPGGPWIQPEQERKEERVHDYDEFVKIMNQIENSSQGAVTIEWYGPTVLGRDIALAIIGTGPTPIMVFAQQHGGERYTAEAMIKIIKNLGSAGNSEVQQILDKFTVLIVPRVNVDGAELGTRRNADNYDINRDHNPTNYPDGFDTFEAALLRDIWGNYLPMIVIDLHHMGTPIRDGQMITVNVSRPFNADSYRELITPDDYPSWPGYEGIEVQSLSKQIGATMYLTLEKMGIGEVELYTRGHASSNPDISRNAFGMLGSATQLVEIRSVGQKSSGYRMQLSYRAVMSVLVSAADGSLFEVDPVVYDAIPPGNWEPSEEEFESH